jgi:hypothetical protein
VQRGWQSFTLHWKILAQLYADSANQTMNVQPKLPAAIDRATLYEDVWATPMSRLGPKYGVSGAAIRKLCDELQVPVPPRGHWMRLESGYSVERPPIPEMMERETRVKKMGRPRKVHSRLAHKAPLPSRPASEPQPVFVEPPEPKHWNPVLSKVRTELAAEAKNAAQLKAKHHWDQAHPGKQYPSRERIWGSWEYFCDAGQLLGERHRKLIP